jgi:hypothetical protein
VPVTTTRTLRALAAVAAIATLFAACSDEQKRDIEGGGVKASLEQQTEAALEDADIELDGSLSCSADIADDNTVTGSCTGTDTEGAEIASSYDGTIDIDEVECSATLTVTRDGETVVTEDDVDCTS